MKEKLIDLHMHSYYSDDGEFSPSELVKMCYEKGVAVMSIADHNTVKGTEEARAEAKRYGISYISGIEIDCTYKHLNLHVLGYGVDNTIKAFQQLEENVHSQEKDAALRKLELTRKLGFEIEKQQLDEISKDGIYTGEIFAEVLLKDGRYEDCKLLLPYREGGSRSDNPYVNFYWDYYAKGKPCYVEIKYPSLVETVNIIEAAGGISVLAHPGNNLKGNFDIIEEMLPFGLKGVEAFSSYHDSYATEYFSQKGRELGLIITCGSDFHGKTKPAIKLGETMQGAQEYQLHKELINRGLL